MAPARHTSEVFRLRPGKASTSLALELFLKSYFTPLPLVGRGQGESCPWLWVSVPVTLHVKGGTGPLCRWYN